MPRRFIAFFAAALLVLVGFAPASEARVPRPAHALGAAIEGPTEYVAQDSCYAVTRYGTRLLGNLLTKTYPGTTYYTTRPCDGSVSEHHDGRAIDWMVSARNATQKAYGDAFAKWLLATDKAGNVAAMARRLGVMYIIFNSRQWGAWNGKWEEYNGCLHGAMRKAVHDNDCHRTHMHISLSWNGARAKTTFWTGRVFRTDYGPCRAAGKQYAPKWSKPNYAGCGDHHH